ncbi:MAG: cheY 2 [Firmicutes bacterium]|nr:cheY 2 [Bacillota bacterium]
MAQIMICDDSLFMRMMLKRIFEESGHKVVAEAGTGHEAVRLFLIHKPDVVTMDITMPELDGVSALKEILLEDAQARVVMVSAIGQQGVVTEAIKAGAADFIVKPFEPERILEVVNNLLT